LDRGPGVVNLELLRAQIAKGGMEPTAVVNCDDKSWKVLDDIGEGFEGHRINRLDLESLHEAFRFSIVIRIAAAAHRPDQAMRDQGVTIELGGVLGELKRWSQHPEERGCDEDSTTAFGSGWSGTFAVTRSALCGWTR